MARPRGVLAWSALQALRRAGRATYREVHGVLARAASALANAVRYVGAGQALLQAARAATRDAVQRVLFDLAHRKHVAPVGAQRVPGSRRPLTVYGPASAAVSRPVAVDPLAAVMAGWRSAA